MKKKNSILELDRDALASWVNDAGLPQYRIDQLWQGLYHGLWQNWDEYTSIPTQTRLLLARDFEPYPILPIQRIVSKDQKTNKVLFRLEDGFSIETVLMLYEQRRTVCISSQVGCAMNCIFCATGQMGYKRNLTVAEIASQVLFFARELRSVGQPLTNVVVMGMGEPFMNYDSVMAAIGRLNNPLGFNLGSRRFTISTVGLPDRIRQFADEDSQVNLAVSLHAASDPHRQEIVPISAKYPLSQVMEACRYYFERTGRRVTFEWALIHGINDTSEQAQMLVLLLRGMQSHVNLIPLNPTPTYAKLPATLDRARAFKSILDQHGIPCTIRIRRGIEIQAGCGQLASRDQDKNRMKANQS